MRSVEDGDLGGLLGDPAGERWAPSGPRRGDEAWSDIRRAYHVFLRLNICGEGIDGKTLMVPVTSTLKCGVAGRDIFGVCHRIDG